MGSYIEQAWQNRCRKQATERRLTFNDKGLLLGKTTLARGKIISDQAAVVVNPTTGEVITTYPSSMYDENIKNILNAVR